MSKIFKICLKINNNISKIFVANGREEDPMELNKYFEKEDIAKIQENNIEVIAINTLIHIDDSIETIKKKLIKYLNCSFEEIYLFANYSKYINAKEIYQMLTQGGKLELSHDRLIQYLLNVDNIDLSKLGEQKEVYTYDDILNLDLNNKNININESLGQYAKSIETNYPYTVDPFSLITIDPFLERSIEDMLVTTNKTLLCQNGTINNNYIYVCLAADVLQYTSTLTITDLSVLNIYFPYLVENEITTLDILLNKKK